jgi:hypothetical protein
MIYMLQEEQVFATPVGVLVTSVEEGEVPIVESSREEEGEDEEFTVDIRDTHKQVPTHRYPHTSTPTQIPI